MFQNIANLQLNNSTGGGISPEIIGRVAPLFGSQDNMLIFSAIVFGLGMRTVYRYYQEKKKGNPDAQQFDVKFLWTAVMAFIAAGLPAMAFMPAATATFNSFVPQWGIAFAWAFTAMGIYTANAAINAAVTGFQKQTIETAVSSGKLDKIIAQRMNALSGQTSQRNRTEENHPPVVLKEEAPQTTTRSEESGSVPESS